MPKRVQQDAAVRGRNRTVNTARAEKYMTLLRVESAVLRLLRRG